MKETADGTGAGLVSWLEYCEDRGLMNKSTARSRRAAVTAVLGIDDGWEDTDLRSLDIEDQARRFEIKEKENYTPRSLETYSSRLRSAVDQYLKFLDDPASYKPPTPTRRTSRGSNGGEGPGSQNDRAESPPPPPRDKLITYPFPLRQNVMAYLQLPPDFKPNEAERLAKFISSIAMTETPALTPGSGQGEENG